MMKQLLMGVSALALTTTAAMAADTVGQPPQDDLSVYFVKQDPFAASGVPAPNPDGNYSEINQANGGNTATTTQAGGTTDNYVSVNQGRANSVGPQNNRATTTQSGNYGSVYINQVSSPGDNTAAVVGSGVPTNFGAAGPNGGTGYASGQFDGTLAVTDAQLGGAGTKNNVTVTQTGDAGAVSAATSNQAVVLQGSQITGVAAGGAIRSVVNITQSGHSNRGEIQQGGGTNDNDGNNQSTLSQTGTNNYAENRQNEADRSNIIQGANAGTGANNTAYVDQIPAIGSNGSDNYGRQSVVRQFGTGNSATVSQGGLRNASAIAQGDNGGGGGGTRDTSGQTATVTQTGLDGYSEIYQGTSVTAGTAANSTATVTQSDTAVTESSYLYQYADSTSATITQAGANDSSIVNQYGQQGQVFVGQGDDPFATFNDPGSNNNRVTINQSAASIQGVAQAYQQGDHNTINVSQTGNGDFAVAEQGGSGAGSSNNSSTITQASNSPIAETYQGYFRPSTNNTATVEQRLGATGYGTYGQIQQDGDSNNATITQDAALVQGFISQDGDSNTATVNQLANAGTVVVITQTGNGNTATTNQ